MSKREHRSGHQHNAPGTNRHRQPRDTPGMAPQLIPADGPRYRCAACEQMMTLPGGYGGTGLCGVCATGEAATMEEIGETW